MFTKRSWESFYSGLIMVGLVFMVFPVIYFCGATKEKQILPPLIMFLLGLVIFVISVHFSVKYHKEKTKYTKYKIDKSLTYTFTLTYGDKVETVTDFSQIEYAIKWLAKYRTGGDRSHAYYGKPEKVLHLLHRQRSVHSHADRAGERRRRGILGRTGKFLQDSHYDTRAALCET